MKVRLKSAAAVTLLLVLVFLAAVTATYYLFAARYPGANDFYSRWRGAQVYWQDGIDPYSDAASLAIQEGIYGRPAEPGEDLGLFVYPFYTVFLMLPYVWLPYGWAQAAWLVTLQFCLLAAVFLTLRLVQWRPPVWLLALAAVWSVLYYSSLRAVILGQLSPFILLWTVGALLALRQGRDGLAAVLLALTTMKPQMSFLLIPALLLWGLGQRRYRFVAGFVAAMLFLVGLAFVMQPGWLSGFMRQVGTYPAYTSTGPPIWVLTGYYLPQLGPAVQSALSATLLLYLLYQWRRLPHVSAASPEFLWLVGLTVIVTNMVVVRTATTNYVILYIPLFLVLRSIGRQWSVVSGQWSAAGGYALVVAYFLGSVVWLWALFAATVQGDLEQPVMYLPLPVGLLTIFIAFRGRLQQKQPAPERATAVLPSPISNL